MNITSGLQPDQRPEHWDNHVVLYEEVFEPLSIAFARQAIARLQPRPGERVLDVAAGTGGAAVVVAEAGAAVTAIDGSPGMIERVRSRAAAAGLPITAQVMDGMALLWPEGTFDAALSVFGVILFPDALKGMAEMRRVVRPGGRVAVVTWTEPNRYELVTALREAVLSLRSEPVGSVPVPAQLRFVDPGTFRRLFVDAGFHQVEIEMVEAHLHIPSARWIAERLEFAPGMHAWMSSLGDLRTAALDAFVAYLEQRHGAGPLRLAAVASIGVARG